MIRIKGKDIIARYFGKKVVNAVYRGVRLIWSAIRSCFGTGTWVSEKPWIGDDTWKNN